MRSVEHGIFLDDEAIDLLRDTGTWLVPALMAGRAVVRAAAAGAPLPEAVVAKAHAAVAEHHNSIARAVAAGVRIAMGTDSGVFPHGENLAKLAPVPLVVGNSHDKSVLSRQLATTSRTVVRRSAASAECGVSGVRRVRGGGLPCWSSWRAGSRGGPSRPGRGWS